MPILNWRLARPLRQNPDQSAVGMQSYHAVVNQILSHVLLTWDSVLGVDTRTQTTGG